MSKNTGIPYEELTKHIFEEVLAQTAVTNVEVRHNVTVQGKTAKHQIDVYWEFLLGNIKYVTLIQAKDLARPVDQGKLLQFRAILDDIPGQPRGIFVTTKGYQKGAKEIAKANGIAIYELRQPTENDWDGSIKDIVLNIQFTLPQFSNVQLVLDDDWKTKERRRVCVPDDEPVIVRGTSGELCLENQAGEQVKSIADVLSEMVQPSDEATTGTQRHVTLDPPLYLPTDHPLLTRVKVDAVTATVSVQTLHRELRLDGDSVVGFILRNVIEGTVQTFSPERNLRSTPPDGAES